jgi:hypothetical protein
MRTRAALIGLIWLLLAGCTSLHRELVLTSGYSPPVNAKILLVEVKAEDEAKEKLEQALNQALQEADLAWRLRGRPLLLAVEVLEWDPNASVWLPGMKSARLKVRAVLKENDRIVGGAKFSYQSYRFGSSRFEEAFTEIARRLVADLRGKLYVF